MLITILTPAYNRAYTLPNLYQSLKMQTNQGFQWYIVDDGSVDNTEEVVKTFQKENAIKIIYERKENGGKHTALNVGIGKITTELTMIVDSDDILTKDAVDTIVNDWETIREKDLSGINYLRGYSETEVIGRQWPSKEQIANTITLTCNQGIIGDKAEVMRTDLLKRHPFLEVPGEKFLSENYVWLNIAKEYDMLMKNKIIYITEYLEGGLSKSGRRMQITSPKGAMANAAICLDKRFSMKIKCKNAILYTCYGKFAHKSFREIYTEAPQKGVMLLGVLPGILLYYFWKKKYLEK